MVLIVFERGLTGDTALPFGERCDLDVFSVAWAVADEDLVNLLKMP